VDISRQDSLLVLPLKHQLNKEKPQRASSTTVSLKSLVLILLCIGWEYLGMNEFLSERAIKMKGEIDTFLKANEDKIVDHVERKAFPGFFVRDNLSISSADFL
jgi:hypothetical protein